MDKKTKDIGRAVDKAIFDNYHRNVERRKQRELKELKELLTPTRESFKGQKHD